MNFTPKRSVALSDGNRRITVDVKPGQKLMLLEEKQEAMIVKPDRYYQLGGQVNDIMASHVLSEIREVRWCSVSQKWEDV